MRLKCSDFRQKSGLRVANVAVIRSNLEFLRIFFSRPVVKNKGKPIKIQSRWTTTRTKVSIKPNQSSLHVFHCLLVLRYMDEHTSADMKDIPEPFPQTISRNTWRVLIPLEQPVAFLLSLFQ